MKPDPIFVEADVRRDQIRKKAVQGIQNAFPFVGKRYTVDVRDIQVHPADISPASHKNALLHAKTLSEPVRGTLLLRDNQTGKVVQQLPRFNLLQLPYFTNHHTFVVNGNSYNVSNQLRMRPGIYTRKRRNEALEATFNLAKGDNFRMSMDQEKGLFNLEYGASKIPLYPVLNKLGVSDEEMAKYWKPELVEVNRKAFADKADRYIDRLYNRMVRPAYRKEGEDQVQAIGRIYDSTVLDPRVTQKTLGKKFTKVTPEAMLSASDKLLRAYKEGVDFDERDDLAYKHLKSADDFIAERIMLEARGLKNKVLSKIERGKSKLDAVPASPFTRSVRNFLSTSALSSNPDQINPIEILDASVRVTSLGEGGISTERAVPKEARRLHTSHLAVLDPVRTPESGRAGIDLRTTIYAGRDEEGNLYSRLWDTKRNRLEWVPVEKMTENAVAFPQQRLTGARGNVDAVYENRIQSLPASKIRYKIPNVASMYSPSSTLIPFIESTDGNRQTMASKMNTQALPLVYSEPPLVQVQGRMGGRVDSMEHELGALVSPRAPVDGIVTAIRDGYVHIRPHVKTAAVGSAKVPYYDNFPLASKTFIHHDLKIKPGDEVRAGQVLADSAFTKDGTLSLGTNLNVAYVPMRGMNSNDAIVISESAAKKLTSQHMYRIGEDLDPNVAASTTKHKSYFGNKYSKEMYDKLDPDGVIKPGMKVRAGDLLIASVRKSELSPEAQMLGKLHKSLVKPFRDAGTTWDKDYEGEVIDVAKAGRKIRLTVKTNAPMGIGDKLCYTEDTEILTKDGWKPVADVTVNDVCYTITVDGNIELHEPVAVHHYPTAGRLYELRSQQVDLRVTENHNLFVKMRNSDNFALIPASDAFGKRCRHRKDGIWTADTPETFDLPELEFPTSGKGCRSVEKAAVRYKELNVRNWLRFLGAYLANGYAITTTKDGRTHDYRVHLCTIRGQQHSVSGDQHAWVGSILDELGFTYNAREVDYIIHSKQLVDYLKQFGHAKDKYIPEEVFSWGKDAAEWILEGLVGCDGCKMSSGCLRYDTISPRLAGDIQRLALHAGYAANIRTDPPSNPKWSTRYSMGFVKARCHPEVNHGHSKTQNGQSESTYVSDEPVYGITVTNNTLYVRVNGKPVWSGNSGKFGDKGVISAVIPDNQMIQDENGNPIDVAISPASVISRINPGQILETALGRVAQKTGKPILVDNFSGKNNVKWVKSELKKHNLKDTETIFDPITGKKIPNVLVGPRHMYKLFKSTDTNYSARGIEDYDVNQQPTSGGPTGSKSVGRLVFNALLAHDARNVLRESAALKSQKNDEWWRAYQLGLPLPPLKTTFAYDKFGAMLAGAGVKMNKTDNQISVGPLTDRDTEKMSAGVVKSPLFVRAKDLRPEKGGLFDPVLTGGPNGTKWSHFDLTEPMISPTMERPVKWLLGMKQSEFDSIMHDEGGRGFQKRLSKLDIENEERATLESLKKLKGPARDQAVKKLKVIRNLQANQVRPETAFVVNKVPIVPPAFRPIIPGKQGDLQINDANYLYRDTMLANDMLKESKGLPENVVGDARRHLYDSMRALYGDADPVSPQLKARNVKGFLSRLAGTGAGPKHGFFHSKLLAKRQDLSGRGTIAPDPALAMDEIGLPEMMAWDMYRPHITRGLVQRGYKAVDARKLIDDKSPVAKGILNNEIRNRPVLVNRAPSLYRYNVLAAYPKLVTGKTIRVHEMLAPIMAGDFDGDAVQIHLPATTEAAEDARKMTLPNMLLSDQEKFTLSKAAPQQEAIAGVYAATTAKRTGKKRTFTNKADAWAAYHRGEIELGTPVEIKK